MNIEKFWELVEECKDADHPEIVLAESLDLLSAEEVLMFAYYLDQMHDYAYRNDIWCAAYLLNGGCGDDGFHYFRYGLISKGRRIYEGALKNPDHLQILWDERPIENEAFGSAAREVYEKKTGIDFFEARIDFLEARFHDFLQSVESNINRSEAGAECP